MIKDLILSSGREEIIKMKYKKSCLFCGVFFCLVCFASLFAGVNKFIAIYKTFNF